MDLNNFPNLFLKRSMAIYWGNYILVKGKYPYIPRLVDAVSGVTLIPLKKDVWNSGLFQVELCPPKKTCWSPNPLYFRMWPYLVTGPLQNWLVSLWKGYLDAESDRGKMAASQGERFGTDLFFIALRRNQVCRHHDHEFLVSRTMRQYIYVV